MKNNSIYIVGATASGKSGLAIDLAKALDGVIINADSMQVYMGANIITASPTVEEKKSVPHKLYNQINPADGLNVVDWCKLAISEFDDCTSQNKIPIFCGGTGLYVNGLLDGISPIPDVADEVRAGVRNIPNEELYKLLQAEDSEMAEKLEVGDTQRICRALEVVRSTGKSLLHFQSLPKQKLQNHIKPLLVALLPERDLVYDKINTRFEKIFNDGVGEVEALLKLGLPNDNQLMRAIGIREIVQYINGEIDRDTAIENGKTATRQYAKRQMTYIRTQLSPDLIIESPTDINLIVNQFKK